MSSYKEITINGLWKQNPGLKQLLGLCPLLGVSNSFINALGLSIVTILILSMSSFLVSCIKAVKDLAVRLPIFVLIIATLACIMELFMQAYTFNLYQTIGLFIPLITTNCIVLGRAESFAVKNNWKLSLYDGFINGLGFSIVLCTLGIIREFFGNGTLFADMHFLIPNLNATIHISENYEQFIFAILPPGAFMLLAFLIAGKNFIEIRYQKIKILNKY